jgi:hypothetical protein
MQTAPAWLFKAPRDMTLGELRYALCVWPFDSWRHRELHIEMCAREFILDLLSS